MESHKNEFESNNNENIEQQQSKIVNIHPGEQVIVQMEDLETKQDQIETLADEARAEAHGTSMRDTAESIKFRRGNQIEKLSADKDTQSPQEDEVVRPNTVGAEINSKNFRNYSKGADSFTPNPAYNQPSIKTGWLRRGLNTLLVGLGLTATTTAGAGTVEKNPSDSIGKKDRIEKVESKESVTVRDMGDWNSFLVWMKEIGMQGKTELDKGGLGYKYLDQYIAEHPGTSLSREKLPKINEYYRELRKWNLNQIKAGKAQFAPGVTEENFMKWVVENDKTDHPEYPGSNFTRQFFPENFVIEYTDGDLNTDKIGAGSMTESGVMGTMANVENVNQKVAAKKSKGFTRIGPDFTKKTNTVGLPGTDIAKDK